MRKMYAGSMIEGAPLGNKNAAGKHGMSGVSKKSSVSIASLGTNKVTGHSFASFARTGGRRSSYDVVSPSSVKRLQGVMSKVAGKSKSFHARTYTLGPKNAGEKYKEIWRTK